MTPTDTILALEKALEAGPTQEWKAAKEPNGRCMGWSAGPDAWLGLATDSKETAAAAALIAACSPLAIRTLLDAHASALRDAERYAAIRSLGWTVNIDHCGDPDSIEVNVACAGNFARKPFDGANELDRIADAARAALTTNTKETT